MTQFLSSHAGGGCWPVEMAASRANGRDPLFDLVAELLGLFRHGLVIGTYALTARRF